MTKTEQKRITQFLYSIPTTEFAIENIKNDIELLDQRMQTPPKITSGEGGIMGGEECSKEERWVLFVDQYQERREYLTAMLAQHQLKVSDYYNTLDKMAELHDWGRLARQICNDKYYRRRSPDVAIYSQLFCAERTFYKHLGQAQRFFLECLPNRFADKRAVCVQ